MWRRSTNLGVALAAGLLWSSTAEAQDPAPSAPPTASSETPNAGGDIVRLKDGSVLRGKISELLQGRSVSIVTLAGKTHDFSMSEVAYAGPENRDPQTQAPSTPHPAPAEVAPQPAAARTNARVSESQPYVTVVGKKADLHLTASEPGVTFHRQAVSMSRFKGYERLCTAPCDISLPAGSETFALSVDDKSPVPADPVTFPAGSSELHASYDSASGIRTAGWIILIGGSVVGWTMFLASLSGSSCSSSDSFNYDTGSTCHAEDHSGLEIAGAAIALGSLSGLFMVNVSDSATVRVASTNRLALPGVHAPGFTLKGSF